MWVNKIIYVTPGESHRGELTSVAESQLRKVAHTTLGWDIENSTKVFRTTAEKMPITDDSLLYLSSKCGKTTEDISEHLYNNLLSSLDDIHDIINSTKEWEVAVVWVTQTELKHVLDSLKENWYNVIDKEKIRNKYTVYAVTIDLHNKASSSFFEVNHGQ